MSVTAFPHQGAWQDNASSYPLLLSRLPARLCAPVQLLPHSGTAVWVTRRVAFSLNSKLRYGNLPYSLANVLMSQLEFKGNLIGSRVNL